MAFPLLATASAPNSRSIAPSLHHALIDMVAAHAEEASFYVKADGTPKVHANATPCAKGAASLAATAALATHELPPPSPISVEPLVSALEAIQTFVTRLNEPLTKGEALAFGKHIGRLAQNGLSGTGPNSEAIAALQKAEAVLAQVQGCPEQAREIVAQGYYGHALCLARHVIAKAGGRA